MEDRYWLSSDIERRILNKRIELLSLLFYSTLYFLLYLLLHEGCHLLTLSILRGRGYIMLDFPSVKVIITKYPEIGNICLIGMIGGIGTAIILGILYLFSKSVIKKSLLTVFIGYQIAYGIGEGLWLQSIIAYPLVNVCILIGSMIGLTKGLHKLFSYWYRNNMFI